MSLGVDIAHTAALVGDPGRANMLALLMDGRAHTATELAQAAGVTRATASGHLAKLEAGRLVSVARQGRHRYFRLASAAVAAMLEGLMVVAAAEAPAALRATPRVPANLREARSCYDHIAGRLGVAIADGLTRRGALVVDGDGARLTPAGAALLASLGVPTPAVGGPRPACRVCLDWSERRPHLAGALGAALLDRALEAGWLVRAASGRELRLTASGAVAMKALGVNDRGAEPNVGRRPAAG